MFPALFSWFWAALSLLAAVHARKRLKSRLLKAALLAGLALNAFAGVANGLVITANGLKMPVERITEERWAAAPKILCDEGDESGVACRTLSLPLVVLDRFRPDDIHRDVGPDDDVNLRWLGDRYPLRFCERSTVYSLGDAFAAIGWMILAPALLLRGAAAAARALLRRAREP